MLILNAILISPCTSNWHLSKDHMLMRTYAKEVVLSHLALVEILQCS